MAGTVPTLGDTPSLAGRIRRSARAYRRAAGHPGSRDHLTVLLRRPRARLGRRRARRRADRRRRHLRHRRRLPPPDASTPGKTYAILEAREAIGGTWDLFRYPGIRSDSDLHTFGYALQAVDATRRRSPTARRSCATSARRRARTGIDRHIRFGHRVVRAEWSTAEARAGRSRRSAPTPARPCELTCRLAVLRQRLLPLRRGLHPAASRASSASRGQVVHPQHWPRGPRLRRQARRRDRQRRDGGDARARRWPAARARDDAPALADLRDPAARADPIANAAARVLRRQRRLRAHPPQEHLAAADGLRAQPAPPAARAPADPRASTPGSCPRATTSTPTSTRATTRGTSACARCPTATCSARCASGDARRSSPTASRRFTERRHPARVRARARGRHRRHGDRTEPARVRRHRADRRRPRGRPRRHARLQGHDAQRRAELRVRDRLHELVVDAEGRPRLRAPLPAARAHGRATATTRACPGQRRSDMETRPLLDFAAGYVQRSVDDLPRQGAARRGSWR